MKKKAIKKNVNEWFGSKDFFIGLLCILLFVLIPLWGFAAFVGWFGATIYRLKMEVYHG